MSESLQSFGADRHDAYVARAARREQPPHAVIDNIVCPPSVFAQDLVEVVSRRTGLCSSEIFSEGRDQARSRARHMITHILRERLNESFPNIAKIIGRDHTTAISGFRRAESLLRYPGGFSSDYRVVIGDLERRGWRFPCFSSFGDEEGV